MKVFRLLAALFVVVLAASTTSTEVLAQVGSRASDAQLPDSVRAMLRQMEQWESLLREIELNTMEQSPELKEAAAEIQRAVASQMRRIDPNVDSLFQRYQQAQQEQVEAERRGRIVELQRLMSEATSLADSISEVQAAAFEARPELEERMAQHQQALLARMKELDPRTDQIVARLEELQARIERSFAVDTTGVGGRGGG